MFNQPSNQPNIDRLQDAIAIMRISKNLDMRSFQNTFDSLKISDSIASLHACGNTACFAGYIAISPMFQNAGGTCGNKGSPKFNGKYSSGALAEYFEISPDLADKLIFGEQNSCWQEIFYPVPFDKITPAHVIQKLEMIISGELK